MVQVFRSYALRKFQVIFCILEYYVIKHSLVIYKLCHSCWKLPLYKREFEFSNFLKK